MINFTVHTTAVQYVKAIFKIYPIKMQTQFQMYFYTGFQYKPNYIQAKKNYLFIFNKRLGLELKKFRVSFFFIRMHLLSSQMENNYKFTVCVGLFSLKTLCHYLYLNVRKTLSGEKKNSLRLPNLVDIIIRKKKRLRFYSC